MKTLKKIHPVVFVVLFAIIYVRFPVSTFFKNNEMGAREAFNKMIIPYQYQDDEYILDEEKGRIYKDLGNNAYIAIAGEVVQKNKDVRSLENIVCKKIQNKFNCQISTTFFGVEKNNGKEEFTFLYSSNIPVDEVTATKDTLTIRGYARQEASGYDYVVNRKTKQVIIKVFTFKESYQNTKYDHPELDTYFIQN